MLMSGLDTHFLEVNVHPLLKIATKGSVRGKKSEILAFWGFFSEANRRSTTKVNYVFFHNFGTFIPCHTSIYILFGSYCMCFCVHSILAATGGWPPAGHFTLVVIGRDMKWNWMIKAFVGAYSSMSIRLLRLCLNKAAGFISLSQFLNFSS